MLVTSVEPEESEQSPEFISQLELPKLGSPQLKNLIFVNNFKIYGWIYTTALTLTTLGTT